MSGRGCRGRPRRAIPEAFERPVIPERVKHAVSSTTASMNQPPVAGQARPSGPIVYYRAGGIDCSNNGYSGSSAVAASTTFAATPRGS